MAANSSVHVAYAYGRYIDKYMAANSSVHVVYRIFNPLTNDKL